MKRACKLVIAAALTLVTFLAVWIGGYVTAVSDLGPYNETWTNSGEWIAPVPASWPAPNEHGFETTWFLTVVDVSYWGHAHPDDMRLLSQRRESTGWPVRMFEAVRTEEGLAPIASLSGGSWEAPDWLLSLFGRRGSAAVNIRVPARPILVGLAVNLGVYAAFWTVVSFFVPRLVRGAAERRRVRRGLCAECGYPASASSVCPECGSTPRRPPQRRSGTGPRPGRLRGRVRGSRRACAGGTL